MATTHVDEDELAALHPHISAASPRQTDNPVAAGAGSLFGRTYPCRSAHPASPRMYRVHRKPYYQRYASSGRRSKINFQCRCAYR